MSELTASEWTYDTPYGKRDFYVLRGDEGMVGVVYREEDARLIAAAPNMYDMLYEALMLLSNKNSWNDDEFALEARNIEKLFDRIYGTEGQDA